VGRSVTLHLQIAKGGKVVNVLAHAQRQVVQQATDHVLGQVDIRGILTSRGLARKVAER
jgi:hypothetical protein